MYCLQLRHGHAPNEKRSIPRWVSAGSVIAGVLLSVLSVVR
jgi:hypothetical protein